MNPKRNFTEEDGDNIIITAIVFLIFVGIACIFLCGCQTGPTQNIPKPQPVAKIFKPTNELPTLLVDANKLVAGNSL